MEEYAKKVGADKIALAHHRDDQAETVLFHLFRGSGPRGLRGMPVKRGPFIRPLLFVSRQEIEAYLAEKQLSYCEDSTNSSLKYSRNILRRQILPVITKNINAQAAAHIAAMAERQEKWCLYIEKQGREAAGRLVRKMCIRDRDCSTAMEWSLWDDFATVCLDSRKNRKKRQKKGKKALNYCAKTPIIKTLQL